MSRKLFSGTGFTAREVAALSGATIAEVHRCAAEGVVRGERVAGERRFPRHAAYFLTVKSQLGGATLSRRLNRKLYSEIAATPDDELPEREIMLTDALRIYAGPRLRTVVRVTCRYMDAREHHITRDPEIKGGIPIIRGSRLDVYSIKQRLDGGESIAHLVTEFPEIPAEAFEAAKLFAETHPRRGRPVIGRPAAA